jgi:hypothetical protein
MPYISQDLRSQIDESLTIDDCVSEIKLIISQAKMKGVANYTISRILLNLLKPNTGWTYSSLCDVIGTLECVKLEIYRRLISEYEDKAIEKNGDVEELVQSAI